MPKRKRFTRSKRIKNKKLWTYYTGVTATDGVFVHPMQATASYPCTIAGLRWEVAVANLSDLTSQTHTKSFFWFMAIYREGTTPESVTEWTTLGQVKPEQNVITWGTGIVSPQQPVIFSGSTKSMRKMQTGDQMFFVFVFTKHINQTHTAAIVIDANAQFFQLS